VQTTFPTIKLPDVTPDERAALRGIRANGAAMAGIKYGYLLTLIRKSRQSGTALYAGTVPAHVKAGRRRKNKAARAARRAAR
jgi:hypothetical protein